MVRMRKTYVRVVVSVRVKLRETVMKASMKVSNELGEPPPSALVSSKSSAATSAPLDGGEPVALAAAAASMAAGDR